MAKQTKTILTILIIAGVIWFAQSRGVNVLAVLSGLGLTLRDGLFAGLGALLMAVIRGR